MLASYRIYSDREIMRFLEIECARDQGAIERTTHMRGVDEVEVWESARFVGWFAVPVLHRSWTPGKNPAT
jgi:hypothetical protein